MTFVKRGLKFKKIELEDLVYIEEFWHKYEPYSDFNALSIWTYNTEDRAEYCFRRGNIILKFPDYLNSEMFFTLMGKRDMTTSVLETINYAMENGINPTLKLIPEVTARIVQKEDRFEIAPDEDNFDYIFSLDDLATLRGERHKDERNLCNKFERLYPNYKVLIVDINQETTKKILRNIYQVWMENKSKQEGNTEMETELVAFTRLLSHSDHFNVTCHLLKANKENVAFCISEPTKKDFVMAAFTKANINYPGAFQFIEKKRAEYFYNNGFKFINIEQDLGIPGLRRSKQSWGPVGYLKKYTIRLKSSLD